MPTESEMKAVLQRYVNGWNDGDVEAIVALFADDAVVEDPYGSPPKRGKDAFREFFAAGAQGGAKLTLDGPIRGSEGDSAAMAFTVDVAGLTIRVIDVMRFDSAGLIAHMAAYWGPGDVSG